MSSIKTRKQLVWLTVLICSIFIAIVWKGKVSEAKCVSNCQFASPKTYDPTCTKQGYTQKECTTCGTPTSDKYNIKAALGHSWSAATCTTAKKCSRCNTTEGNPLNHDWSDATCTAPATCKRYGCGATNGSKLNHSWGDWKVTKEATCTKNGKKKRTCVRGCVEEKTIDKKGHKEGAAATCTTAQMCTRSGCGTTLQEALGHAPGASATCTTAQTCTRSGCGTIIKKALDHAWADATCFAPATCKRTGCGATTGKPKGHTWQAATCKAPKTCIACGYTEGSKADHVPLTGATCTTASVCRTCGTVLQAALGHAPGADATCTTAQKCTRSGCGATIKEALGHAPGADATCTTAQKCTRSGCGATIKAALGHDWSEATCFAPKTCKRTGCHATEGNPKGHTWQAATCKAPKTCTTCGHTEGSKADHVPLTGATCTTASVCRTCGIVLKEALGHAPGAEATCTTAQKCTRSGCGATIKAALGHVPGATATCTTAQKCTRSGCGATIKAALGHDWSEATCFAPKTCKRTGCYTTEGSPKGHTWQAATCKAPKTCTACGYKEGGLAEHVALTGATCTTASVCRTCGITLHEALGHEPGPEATCTTKQKCIRYGCGTVLADKKPHKYETITIAPGCLTPGLEQEKCACGNVKSSKEVPALDHAWKDWEVLKEATCEQDGYRKHTCNRCSTTVSETVEKLGHEYSNGICTRCKKYENYEGIRVTFDANGGDGAQYINPISVIPGETYGKLPAGPTRHGYTFKGWYTTKRGGTEVTASTKVTKTSDHTLYAQWTAGEYTIEFNGNGSTSGSMSSRTVEYGKSEQLPENAYKKTGYIFAGWNEKADGTGKGYLDEAYVENLTTVKNGKIILYAQWVEGYYTIHYDANGGTGAPPSHEAVIGKTGNLSGRTPTREGCEFLGWSLDEFALVPDYQPGDVFPKEDDKSSVKTAAKSKGEVTLYAVWSKTEYTVTFYPNGGKGDAVSRTVAGGDKVLRVPEFSREGYIFKGWGRSEKEGNQYLDMIAYEPDEDIIVTENMNLYAKWVPLTYYELKYDLMGGYSEKALDIEHILIGQTVTLSDVTPTKPGCTFAGWSLLDEDSHPDYLPSGQFPNKDDASYINKKAASGDDGIYTATLKAQWSQNRDVPVTFVLNNGEKDKVLWKPLNDMIDGPMPTKEGYNLKGWSKIENSSELEYRAAQKILVEENLKLYAVWEELPKFEIVFDYNDGITDPKKFTVKYGDRISMPEMEREDYVLKGWRRTSGLNTIAEYKPGEEIDVRESASFQAVWGRKVTVTFKYGGDQDYTWYESTYAGGKVLAQDVKYPTSKMLNGWSDKEDENAHILYQVGDKIIVNNDMTLYAQWSDSEGERLVNYHLREGELPGGTPSKKYALDEKFNILESIPKRKYYQFLGWRVGDSIGRIYQPGALFPDERDYDYYRYNAMTNIDFYDQWHEICDTEMVMNLQKTYGAEAMSDDKFLKANMSPSWDKISNTAFYVLKTTEDPIEKGDMLIGGDTLIECENYYSEVFVIEKMPSKIVFDVYYSDNYPGKSSTWLRRQELSILESHSNSVGVALVSGIRLLEAAAGTAVDTVVAVCIPGGKVVLIGRDIFSMIDDVQALYEYINDPSKSNDKVIVSEAGVTVSGISLSKTAIDEFKNLAEDLDSFLMPGGDLCEELLGAVADELTIAGYLLDLCDFWESVGRSCYEQVDPNGGLDEVAGFYVDMLKESGFGEGVTSGVGSVLTNLYNASYSSTSSVKTYSAMADNEVCQTKNIVIYALCAMTTSIGVNVVSMGN